MARRHLLPTTGARREAHATAAPMIGRSEI
jgi:hypothetical protein